MNLKLSREELAALQAMLISPGFQVFQKLLNEECKSIDTFQIPTDVYSSVKRERDLGRLDALSKISSIINNALEISNG